MWTYVLGNDRTIWASPHPRRVNTYRDPVETIGYPSWNQVSSALHRLDGYRFNQFDLHLPSLDDSPGKMLFVGGGDGGRYIVTYLPEPDDCKGAYTTYTLTDHTLNGPDVQLTVQTPSWYPSKFCVRLPLVLNAFEHFYTHGAVPSYLHWTRDIELGQY